MNELKGKVGFEPPTEEVQGDLKADIIFEFMKEVKASYPAEVGVELDMSKDTVYRKLRQLEKQGKIKRASLEGKETVPNWLKPRIQTLWARGLKGDAIRRMTWYRLVEDDGKKA